MVRMIQKISDYVAKRSILFYQKYISPYKGFCCAYRHRTGGHSCSSFALKIVRRYGAFGLIRALPKQFKRCELAYLATQEEREEEQKKKEKHGAFDWCVIDPCDCTPDLPKGCPSTPSDGGAGGCDMDLDCGVLDGCSNPLDGCDCMPSFRIKRLFRKHR